MKRNTLERREKIKDLIISEGLWSLNKKQLSREFKVSYPSEKLLIQSIDNL